MLQKIVIKKWLGALALVLVVCYQLAANPVSIDEAQKVALNFYKTSFPTYHNQLTIVLKYTQIEADNTITFYVFDINPVHSFVIVSADNRVMPVLAYSTETNFNTGFKSTGLSNWIQEKSAEVHYIIQNNLQVDARTTILWSDYEQGLQSLALKNSSVAPLCATIWDQENPASTPPPPYLYNLLCPYNNSDQQRSLTGCVATAMAQVMKYWNFPTQGAGSYSYDDNQVHDFSNNYGTLSANFGSTYYQWAEMPNSLNTSCSTSSDSAISVLMYQCGVAIATDYGDDNQGGSGAFVLQSDAGSGQPCAEAAFGAYFSYNSNSIQGVKKSNYNSSGWTNLIENELNASRPVICQGTDPNYGSHAWVCDGYDQNDNLHMNWGWSGQDDGFYAINSLNPLSYDFSQDNEALIGIQPSLSLRVSAQTANSAICSGTSTILTAQGPVNATYSWSPTEGLSCSTCASTDAYPYYSTTYTVTVDSFGYTGTASVSVNVDTYLDIDIGDIKNVSCHGLSDGSIALAVSGGTGAYSYLWNTGQTTDSISNLAAGTYKVTVTDIINCSGSTSKTITQPNDLNIQLYPTNGSCYSSGGSISTYVSGGTWGYNYTWSNGAGTSSITQLIGATYTLTVTDSHDYTATASAGVNSTGSVMINPEITNVNCFDEDDGSISLNVISGTPPFSYSWNNGLQNDTLSNLSAGTYSVTITDNNHCSTAKNISITQPDKIIINTASGNGSASVNNVTGGTPPYSYAWSNGQTGSIISNVAQGTYTVTVTDSKGCQETASVSVNSATGINNLSTTPSFNIYPNPAKADIVLQLDNLDNEPILTFRNILGQELFTKPITGLNTTISLSAFADGVYFAELHQGEKIAVRQIVLNK